MDAQLFIWQLLSEGYSDDISVSKNTLHSVVFSQLVIVGDGTHISSTQNPDPERDLMEGTSKQHNDHEQAKRYAFMNENNQHHPAHSVANISSCPNTGIYTDTLTYKKSVSFEHYTLLNTVLI